MGLPRTNMPRPPHRRERPAAALRAARRNRGLTLIELLIVLVILVAVAGMVTLTISGGVTVRDANGEDRTPEEIATLDTMRTVRDALVGASPTEPGYRQDLGTLPSRLGGLIRNIDGEPLYDPATKRGWRGPYLYDAGTRYGDFIDAGDAFPTTPPALLDDPALLDGWGKPLLLQEPLVNGGEDARLVSAGPNRILETDPGNPVDADRGDDLILFLLTDDPNL